MMVAGSPSGWEWRKHVSHVDASRFSCLIADDNPSVTLAVSQLLSDVTGIDPSRFVTFTGSAELLRTCAASLRESRLVVLYLVMPGQLKRVALESGVGHTYDLYGPL
ncbi:hypothetical protein XpopCFBP1817_19405 [Xanthomonas populi]|uniref:Response regulatory domain-containing protein n=1 Tax=Xanthomonas populi TaxID=53414 RepID=A0A2S7E8D2_9XANT|nr:hypothetical protein [Xanthomonas populi]PPU86340.1 hypothetical protein XpopCFBP1817_19405 [Xanthomonas populi]